MRKKITIDLTEDQIAAIRKEFLADLLELSANGTPGALLAQPWPEKGTMEITLMQPSERRAIYKIGSTAATPGATGKNRRPSIE